MARTPVLAAGGIVLRLEDTPLIAVVRLRKRNEWVLPKGKLDDGETPRAAAEREVNEETGHDVAVHEFLGTLVYESRGGSKVVHYWRMEAGGEPVLELMSDVKAVDWLPLAEALERLSRGYERSFIENVGPIALAAARVSPRPARPIIAQSPAHRRGRAGLRPAQEPDAEGVGLAAACGLRPKLVMPGQSAKRVFAVAAPMRVATPANSAPRQNLTAAPSLPYTIPRP